MSDLVVHYFPDISSGLVYVHFSGSKNQYGVCTANVFTANKQVFKLAVDVAKQIPTGKRDYNPHTEVWTFDAQYFNNNLKPFFEKAPQWFEFCPYSNLLAWRIFIGEIKSEDTKPVINPSDPDHVKAANFFHNFNTVVEQAVNTQGDKKTLVALTGVSDYSVIDRADAATLKKLYRATAIKLHPDKNGGNHSDMSTFTQLWGIYVQPRI